MSKILFIGGTRFFGKKAVELLVEAGYEVTIASRGNIEIPKKDQVKHITLDARDNNHVGWQEILGQSWDGVYHSVLYTREDAVIAIEKLKDVTDHLYYTSSMAVYSPKQGGFREEDFDPLTYVINPEAEVTYGRGKRQVEATLFTKAPFKVTAFRFPIVLDHDDYTLRLHFYIEEVLADKTLHFHSPDNKVSYVKGSTAAEAILWAIENNKTGIYNVSVTDVITVEEFIQWLAEGTGKKVKVEYGSSSEESPFNFDHDSFVISDKIISESFQLETLESWLKPLIHDLAKELHA